MELFLVFCLTFSLIAGQNIWPLPSAISLGQDSLSVDPSTFKFVTDSQSDILAQGIQRYKNLIFYPCRNQTQNAPQGGSLSVVNIAVSSSSESLQLETLENYTLVIEGTQGTLKAATVFGALYGLETFSQLVECNGGKYSLPSPVHISDSPRFPHRGLLVDSARHFLPLSVLKRAVESLSFNKLNVLHWHVSDAESFPLVVPAYPNLTQGSYGPSFQYTAQEVQELVQFAKYRGVRVIPEFDTPGHTYSWGIGYPDVVAKCPTWSKNINNVPLTPANPLAMEIVEGVFLEASKVFSDDYVHIGGDEVEYICWKEDSALTQWMSREGIPSYNALMQYYENQLWSYLGKLSKKFIVWEEIFNGYELTLPSSLIVEVWKDETTLYEVAAANYQGILAYGWYLDHLQLSWKDFYSNEPFQSSQWDAHTESFILGGEAAAWGETLDAENFDQRVWPRTSAAAERLWSPKGVTDVTSATPRLAHFICLLNRRGIAAGPIAPGYCP